MTVAVSGCFRYVPAQLETTPPGQGVRVLVTRQGAEELRSITTVDRDAAFVAGSVVGVEGDDLLLEVPLGQRQEGFITNRLNQTIRVPQGEIISFERREVDKLATGLVVGAGVAVVTGVVAFIIKPFGREEPPPGPDPPELQMRFSLFSIPVGR